MEVLLSRNFLINRIQSEMSSKQILEGHEWKALHFYITNSPYARIEVNKWMLLIYSSLKNARSI